MVDNHDPYYLVITPVRPGSRQWPGHPTSVQLSFGRCHRPPRKTIAPRTGKSSRNAASSP